MKLNSKIAAIIWDYDGTLVDSRQKNLNVTRQIITDILHRDINEFPALQNKEIYHYSQSITMNWRSFYKDQFGMNDSEIDSAGALWTSMQMEDQTPAPLFPGIRDVLAGLSEHRQAIVSQNSQHIIKRTLKAEGIEGYFDQVVGYEEVDLSRQKPHPDGLLACIDHLGISNSGDFAYIGDHEADVECAVNANKVLTNNRVIAIAALYGYGHNTKNWKLKPDHEVNNQDEISQLILSSLS
jgi:HAD superfamily hydrolase (TIGR01549 family)